MKSPRLLLAVLLVIFLFVQIVATIPARVLHLVVPQGQIFLQGLSGTIWQGSASSVQLRLSQGYLQLGEVQWSLHPLSLLQLAPHLTVSSAWGRQAFTGDVILRGRQSIDLNDVQGQVAADLLRHFAPVLLAGTFEVQVAALQIRNGLPHSAQGRLLWLDGSWQSPRGSVALGSYALDFEQAPGAVLRGEVSTIMGPLTANGSVALSDRRYQVDIVMGAQETLDAQLEQTLPLIALQEGDDYRIQLEGEF